MAFKKMDIKSTVENERKDMEFDREYRRIKKEYALVEQLVKARKEYYAKGTSRGNRHIPASNIKD